jgi:exodeoxyribonuclease V alpha subunit
VTYDATLARRATGLLREFNAAGVLTAADVHVAQRLGQHGVEDDEQVLLAVALTVRGTRHGSVVLDLATAAGTITVEADDESSAEAPLVALPWPDAAQWVARCAESPLVLGVAGGPPLQLDGSRMWLDRYWRQERQIAADLLALSASRPGDLDVARLAADLTELFPGDAADDQRRAAAVAAVSRVSVIAGGPGTGKTTTIARLLAVLLRQLGPGLRVALTAPTGKAAARLEEAVRSAGAPLTGTDRAALSGLSASTLHRLLGRSPGVQSRFRHDRTNRLPYDVVVVDESSMVSLTLMARLLEALPPATRLCLVGDPDQLASVEAGAVLGDLVDPGESGSLTAGFAADLRAVVPLDVPASIAVRADSPGAALRDSVVVLRKVHRFEATSAIAELADAVRRGSGDEALALLRGQPPGLEFHEIADDQPVPGATLATVRSQVETHEGAMIAAAVSGTVDAALDGLEGHRLLCAHRLGPRGVQHWTDLAESWLPGEQQSVARQDGRYAGQPLLVTSNDYETGLYNGDSGVVVARDGELVAAFRRGGAPIVVPLVRLSDVRPLHAMTVHRAQGSQFRGVTVLLPLAGSPLATRETVYTAVTRASEHVRVIGSAASVLASVARPVARATGLRDRLR